MEGRELELTFHDNVPLEESALPEAREKASVQKHRILLFFMSHQNETFTPAEVWETLHIPLLLTSVRRSITDLTKEGRLIKCDYSESRAGQYGTLNRCWRYNSEYVKPITPARKTLDKNWGQL